MKDQMCTLTYRSLLRVGLFKDKGKKQTKMKSHRNVLSKETLGAQSHIYPCNIQILVYA